MKIKCPGCHKAYDLPDDKLPQKKISFKCPECKEVINLDLRPEKSKNRPDSEPFVQKNHLSDLEHKNTDSDHENAGNSLKKKILKSISDLPPMPQVVLKVREIMANPTLSFKDIAEAIETDQAIAARLLKIANSTYYGMSGMVASIHQACVVLGYKTLAEAVTIAGTSSLLGKKLKGYELDSEALWQHSLEVALGSKAIARIKRPVFENEAFSAGLIHDSGKLVLDQYVLEKKDQFNDFMKNNQHSFLMAEKHILGFEHAEIASALCEQWQMPQNQSVGIKFHHLPSESKKNDIAYIIHIADSISRLDEIDMEYLQTILEEGSLEFLGLQEKELNEILSEVKEAVQKITDSA